LKLFTRRWWLATLLVIAGVAVLIRLGFWQLDRLDQRRAFNRMVAERWQQTPYDLNDNALPADLHELEYRRVELNGRFDYSHQIVLQGQTQDGAPGVKLVTPLVIAPERAVLVMRGWVPYDRSAPEFWPQFEEPAGAPVIGLIQESQLLPNGQPPSVPATSQVEWWTLNVDAIQPQMPYTLMPVLIWQLPEENRPYGALPYRAEPLTLDEGNHFSYAMQWFTFALILGVGYLFFVRAQELRRLRLAGTPDSPPPGEAQEPVATSDPPPGLPHPQGHA
jgi:surfeit locus 1 family protein